VRHRERHNELKFQWREENDMKEETIPAQRLKNRQGFSIMYNKKKVGDAKRRQ